MTRMVTPTIFREGPKEGKGFSRAELEEAGISIGDTMRLGIPMDKRRGTKYEENVERLKAYTEEAKKAGVKIGRPRSRSKAKRGRVYRGLTSAGKKVRGLRK
jgi:ribosomal protein L13E